MSDSISSYRDRKSREKRKRKRDAWNQKVDPGELVLFDSYTYTDCNILAKTLSEANGRGVKIKFQEKGKITEKSYPIRRLDARPFGGQQVHITPTFDKRPVDLMEMVENSSQEDTFIVACCPRAPEEALKKAILVEEREIHRRIAYNPASTEKVLRLLRDHSNVEDIQSYAAHRIEKGDLRF